MRFLILIFGSLLLCNAYAADDCNVDIREHFSPELKEYFTHPHDQSNSGFCHAFVAADLFSVALGQPVSPYDIGFAAAEYVNKKAEPKVPDLGQNSLNRGGPPVSIYDDLHAVLSRGIGVCGFNEMPAAYKNWVQGWSSFTESMSQLYAVRKVVQVGGDEQGNPTEIDCRLGVQAFMPELSLPAIVEILQKAGDKNFVDVAAELAKKSCKNRLPVRNSLEQYFFNTDKTSPKESKSIINDILSKGFPLAVLLDEKMLTGNKKDQDRHFLTLIGKKRVGSRCMYVLRNSWGIGCKAYSETYGQFCDPKSGTLMIPEAGLLSTKNVVFHFFADKNQSTAANDGG